MAAAAVGVHLLALEVEAARERGSGCSGGCLHHSPPPSCSALEEAHSAADPPPQGCSGHRTPGGSMGVVRGRSLPGGGGTGALTAGHCHVCPAPLVGDLLLLLPHTAHPWGTGGAVRQAWVQQLSKEGRKPLAARAPKVTPLTHSPDLTALPRTRACAC